MGSPGDPTLWGTPGTLGTSGHPEEPWGTPGNPGKPRPTGDPIATGPTHKIGKKPSGKPNIGKA